MKHQRPEDTDRERMNMAETVTVTVTVTETETSILRVVDAYRQAVLDRDVDAFMRLYDDHVRVFDTWGVWSHEGSAAWRQVADRWFSSLGTEHVRVTAHELQVIGGGDSRVLSGAFRYAATSAEGVELRAMQNRLTWVLRADGES
jgi:ketosteroid isomerase-like protein